MGCTHDCSSCSSDCKSKEQNLHEELNKYSSVKKVIGDVSGKGGEGKSLVTSMLAVTFNRLGKMISVNLLLEHETDPVVWRSPVITGTVKQFWKDVIWENVDYMFVDMPPGTGDVPLTVFQSLPIDGIVIVASPQELVSMIVQKAVKMARMMNVPILGLVENMSWFMCPNCGKKHSIFGDSRIEKVAKEYDTQVLAKLPIEPELAKCVDEGKIEFFEGNYLDEAAEIIEKELSK